MTPREIEKLQAIGYNFTQYKWGHIWLPPRGARPLVDKEFNFGIVDAESGSLDMAKAHAQSAEGLKATMADKVRYINEKHLRGVLVEPVWEDGDSDFYATLTRQDGRGKHTEGGQSPEAAVDALFWAVA